MAIGVVPLEIVVTLLDLVVFRAHFDCDGALLRSRLVVVDKVDGRRLWKEEWISAYHGGQQGRLISPSLIRARGGRPWLGADSKIADLLSSFNVGVVLEFAEDAFRSSYISIYFRSCLQRVKRV